jgi:hypothetical protein
MKKEYGGKSWAYVKTLVCATLLLTTTLVYGELELVGKIQRLDLDANEVILNDAAYSIDRDHLKIMIQGTQIQPQMIGDAQNLEVRVTVHEPKSTSSVEKPQTDQSPARRSISAIEVIGPKEFVEGFFNH